MGKPETSVYAAFKDGEIFRAWKSIPDGYDIEGLEYDEIRQLTPKELKALEKELKDPNGRFDKC